MNHIYNYIDTRMANHGNISKGAITMPNICRQILQSLRSKSSSLVENIYESSLNGLPRYCDIDHIYRTNSLLCQVFV